MSDEWYEDDYAFESEYFDAELNEYNEEPDCEAALRPARTKPNPLLGFHLKSSLSKLHHVHQYSHKSHIRHLSLQLLAEEPIKHQHAFWLSIANPIYHSIDDYHLTSNRRGLIAGLWESRLYSGIKDAEYYIKHPESMHWPLVHSLRSNLWDYPFSSARFFDEDMQEFMWEIETILERIKARKAHKKRHQTRAKPKRGKKKAKTAAQDADPPGKDTSMDVTVDPA